MLNFPTQSRPTASMNTIQANISLQINTAFTGLILDSKKRKKAKIQQIPKIELLAPVKSRKSKKSKNPEIRVDFFPIKYLSCEYEGEICTKRRQNQYRLASRHFCRFWPFWPFLAKTRLKRRKIELSMAVTSRKLKKSKNPQIRVESITTKFTSCKSDPELRKNGREITTLSA